MDIKFRNDSFGAFLDKTPLSKTEPVIKTASAPLDAFSFLEEDESIRTARTKQQDRQIALRQQKKKQKHEESRKDKAKSIAKSKEDSKQRAKGAISDSVVSAAKGESYGNIALKQYLVEEFEGKKFPNDALKDRHNAVKEVSISTLLNRASNDEDDYQKDAQKQLKPILEEILKEAESAEASSGPEEKEDEESEDEVETQEEESKDSSSEDSSSEEQDKEEAKVDFEVSYTQNLDEDLADMSKEQKDDIVADDPASATAQAVQTAPSNLTPSDVVEVGKGGEEIPITDKEIAPRVIRNKARLIMDLVEEGKMAEALLEVERLGKAGKIGTMEALMDAIDARFEKRIDTLGDGDKEKYKKLSKEYDDFQDKMDNLNEEIIKLKEQPADEEQPTEKAQPTDGKASDLNMPFISAPDNSALNESLPDFTSIRDKLYENVDKNLQARVNKTDGELTDSIDRLGGKTYKDYAYREKLTLEMNTRVPTTTYGLDKIQVPLESGGTISLLYILKNHSEDIDLDNDMTPSEMTDAIYSSIQKLKGLDKDAFKPIIASILTNPAFPALKDTVNEMGDIGFMDTFDMQSMVSLLRNKLELSPEKRKEALSKLPKLNNKPFNDEESELWDELMLDLDYDETLEAKSLGEKRIFMKEYFNQLATAQKMLQNSKSPEAFKNLLNVMEAELDGGEARYASLSEGDFYTRTITHTDPETGEVSETKVFLNPHVYSKENIEKQEKDLESNLDKVHQGVEVAKKQLKEIEKSIAKAQHTPSPISDLYNQFKDKKFTDEEFKHALSYQQKSLESYIKVIEGQVKSLQVGVSQNRTLGDENNETQEELEEMTEALKSLRDQQQQLKELSSSEDVLKQLKKKAPLMEKKKAEDAEKLQKKKKEIEDSLSVMDTIGRQLEEEQNNLKIIKDGMEPVYKEREELEEGKKNFNKGPNPFKIDGQRATFEQALEAKHHLALAIAVKELQGRQYAGGKNLSQALKDCEKDAKTCDKKAIADKKIIMDYHHAVLNRKEELNSRAEEDTKASKRMEQIRAEYEGKVAPKEVFDEYEGLSKKLMTPQEKEELAKLQEGGVGDDDNLTPQQLATKSVLNHLKTKQYNPDHITRNVPLPKSHEEDKGDAIEAFAKTYNSIGDAELKNAEKEVTAQLKVYEDKLNNKQSLTPEEELKMERLEQSIDALTLVAQSRGLPLPQGRTPVDPQLMAFLEEDSDIPPQRRKEALKIIGNLSRGAKVEVIDTATGKKTMNINEKARQIASDGYSELLDLLDNQSFAEMMASVDKNRTTSLTELSKMLEDDFCASGDNRGGDCVPLNDKQKAEIRKRMKLEYMTAVDTTPDFFAPPASGDSYMRDAKAYLNKREKGNTYFDTDIGDYYKSEYKKGRGGYGRSSEDEDESAPSIPWATRLDGELFEDMRRTQKAMSKGKAGETVAGQKWSTPQVEDALNEADSVLKAVAKSGKATPQQQEALDKAKEFLSTVFTKEMGKAKVDPADRKQIERLTEDIKQELKKDKPNYRAIETKWEEKKKLLKKNGLDVSKMKTPPGGAKNYGGYGDYDSDFYSSGDIFGGRTASNYTSFMKNPLTYINGSSNTMKKHAYVDYQGRAQLFKPGMSVYHALNGNPSVSGIVRAVYPAIGMVDVQFPMGDQRLPVEDLMIARDIPLDPLLDKASIPGGTGTQPVSAGAVRVASLYMRMKGRR